MVKMSRYLVGEKCQKFSKQFSQYLKPTQSTYFKSAAIRFKFVETFNQFERGEITWEANLSKIW